jgi:hypothetical protein
MNCIIVTVTTGAHNACIDSGLIRVRGGVVSICTLSDANGGELGGTTDRANEMAGHLGDVE